MVLRLVLCTGLWLIVVLNVLAVPGAKKQEQQCSSARKSTSIREIKTKKKDSTKVWPFKNDQLLHIKDHDFAIRPGFGGAPVPVGIDVQIESIDRISEVDMDFTMTFYLRHYWKDERLSFPSTRNKSMTFDGRLIQRIWVPDVFFVHSKRSFIHDTTLENIMLRVYPDGNILFSLRITVSAMCFMDFSRFPLDTQNCSLELESYAYNEEDLMLYWKHGNKSLNTDEHVSLSQFFIEEFSASSGLAFYSSTGWYNRLFINFVLRRHIFFFVLQSYFPAMLMVMLSWVSFWIDRRAVPARVSLGFLGFHGQRICHLAVRVGDGILRYLVGLILGQQIDDHLDCAQSLYSDMELPKAHQSSLQGSWITGITTVLTMSTVITGASASMPQVSYIKAVDIYLWVSFLFVFMSVIEYAAVNYLTTVEERKQFKKRGKISGIYNIEAVQAMAFDGCYHDSETDIDMTPFSIHSEEYSVTSRNPGIPTTDSAPLKRKKSLRGHVGRIILKNNHVIDTYSRIVFPTMFIVFNFFYWGFYV